MKNLKYQLFGVVVILAVGFTVRVSGQDKPQLAVGLGPAYHQGQFTAILNGGFHNWENGYLVSYGLNGTVEATPSKSVVEVYDKYGAVAREAVVWFDHAKLITVTGAAVNRSGKLFVSGGSISEQGANATFIAEIGSDNRVQRVIRTSPFSPKYLCAMEDGTIWSYGQDRDDHLNNIQNSLRLRHFSFEKGQLQALLDTSVLNDDWSLDRGKYPGDINLRCNSKTVILYNGSTGDLIEVDVATNRLNFTKVDPLPPAPKFVITGFALTSSGNIFASFLDLTQKPQKPAVSGLFRLSRDNAKGTSWSPVQGTVGLYLHGSPIQRLMGADGDDLVYTSLKDGIMFWSKHNAE